jgi:K+-sensing histidine kinase KdpD
VDEPAEDERADGLPFGGRRRHAIEMENRPTRLLSDQRQVHDLLAVGQRMALAKSVKDALEMGVRALMRHTSAQWAVAWRERESGDGAIHAGVNVEQVPEIARQLIEHYGDTGIPHHSSEGEYSSAQMVVVPILRAGRPVGGVAIQVAKGEATEDELLDLEFIAMLCAAGEAYGEVLDEKERADHERERARAAQKEQEDVLRMVSHDVRNPLAIIRGYAQMLQQSGEALDDDQREQMLGKVMGQVDRIERLVDGILDVARAEHGRLRLNLQVVDAREIVRQAVAQVDPDGLYQVHAPSEPVMAHVDRLRVEQVVANLVGNALKYGQAPYSVRMADGDEHWHLMVADAGEGLPAEVEDNLFQKFVPGARNVGLGLSIVQAFVHAHGGTINYRRGMREGQRECAFVISLPKRPAPQ